MSVSSLKRPLVGLFLAIVWTGSVLDVSAASYELVAIEDVFNDPLQAGPVQPFAIVITSSSRHFDSLAQNTRDALKNYLVYQTKINVGGRIFYRLALGNFESIAAARASLVQINQLFADAWVYQRTAAEQRQLDEFLNRVRGKQPAEPEPIIPESADSMLQMARQAFLDGNYARVIAIADRVVRVGTLEQTRLALELAGTARERQGNFTQAESLYRALLDTDPSPEVSARISSRLEGIRTMAMQPRERLPDPGRESDQATWNFRGALQQYYRDDVIDRSDDGSEDINQALVTDVNLRAQRRSDASTLSILFDGGLIYDFIEDRSENRVSQAYLSYARDSFSIIAGRQYRTVTGVYGRFDGIMISDLSRSAFQTSFFLGTNVQSSFDGIDSDNPLVGANIDFSPYEWLDVNLFAINQEISGLTDRQAIGSEFQLQNDDGFVYGIVDYDIFYQDLNNLTFISNYRYSPHWSFNLTLGHLNSPLLSTLNALQGQAAGTIDELGQTFSPDEIYQLAEDRTSKSDTLYFGATYNLDSNRQLNLDLSIFEIDATEASGGVDAIPASRETQLSVEYSVSGFFSDRDYTSIGVRLSELESSDVESVRLRSRFPGSGGLIYDPRIRLDHRRSTRTNISQFILNPSIRLLYRKSQNLNLEFAFGLEYSELDLPDFDRQTAYSLFLGYDYFF